MTGLSRNALIQGVAALLIGAIAGAVGAQGGTPAVGVALGLWVGAMGAVILVVRARAQHERIARLDSMARGLAVGRLDPGPVDLGAKDEIAAVARSLMTAMGRLQGLKQHLDLAATGDLSGTTVAEGDLARSLVGMITQQRSMVERIGRAASRLDGTSARMLGTTRQQEANAAQQAAVVEEILRTMQGVAENAARVSSRAEEVLRLAERTDGNNREINGRIQLLANQAARIAEVLDRIGEIAHKSEILALNAALEGTRAGEAGRGFSLVAGQMGQLSESVLAAVVDIQELTRDIGEATRAAVASAEEAAEGSAATARAAREIRQSVQQQNVATQQVGRGLEEISAALHEASTAARAGSHDAEDLAEQSTKLRDLVGRFNVSQVR